MDRKKSGEKGSERGNRIDRGGRERWRLVLQVSN